MIKLFKKKPEGEVVEIGKAAEDGLISFELLGAGEGVTSKVILKVKKLTPDPLVLLIPEGRMFTPKEEVK